MWRKILAEDRLRGDDAIYPHVTDDCFGNEVRFLILFLRSGCSATSCQCVLSKVSAILCKCPPLLCSAHVRIHDTQAALLFTLVTIGDDEQSDDDDDKVFRVVRHAHVSELGTLCVCVCVCVCACVCVCVCVCASLGVH